MESIEDRQYQQDDTQEQIIELFQSQDIPSTVIVLASPGTGKTTTISRIIEAKALNRNKQSKCNFLVLTFTRKTRYDLIAKLKKLPGKYLMKKYVRSRVKNFHSFAFDVVEWDHLLDEGAETRKINNFLRKLKLNDNDEENLRKEIIRVKKDLLAKGYNENQWNEVIESLKNHHNCHYVSKFLREYKDWLEVEYNENRSITYDYSLIKTIEQINNGGKPRKGTIDLDSLELLIVDEFQDSNPAQLKIVEALIKRSKKEVKLLMVGDFDQNIYNWRGADIQYIDEFVRSRNPKTMYLGNSYRMGESLKNLSQKLIKSFIPYEFFRKRLYKGYKLNAKGRYNQQVEVRVFEKEVSEVRWTVDKIYYHMSKGVPFGEMTILLRSIKIAFMRLLTEEIKQRKQKGFPEIPYEVKLNNDVLKSATVKYLFAILQYFKKVEKDDTEREIKRILYPINYVGQADEVRNQMIKNKKISRAYFAYEHKQTNYEKRRENWTYFLDDWQKIEKIIRNCPKNGFIMACKQIFQILRDAKWGDAELQEDKIKDFYDLVEDVLESINEEILEIDPIFAVYYQLSLLADSQLSGEQQHDSNDMLISRRKNRLQIQTIHTSKGLQFEVVILSALNFEHPNWQKKHNRFSIQFATSKIDHHKWNRIEQEKEELRVIYTAITRSSHYCYVNSSKEFERPNWLKKSDVKQHPQFRFLRQHGKFIGVIPYQPLMEENEPDERQKKQLQKLISNMSIK